jgi:sulfoxide reductase catalytic subunit YedY
MEYKIVGDVMQALEITLRQGEELYAEAGSMLYMGPGIDLQARMQGGVVKGLMRKFLAGESMFMSVFRCESSQAKMALANPIAGKIFPVELRGNTILAERNAYLCGIGNIDLSVAFTKRFGAGLFGGEGFILQKLSGNGLVFLHAGGNILEFNLGAGEHLRVDTGCIVSMADTVTYDRELLAAMALAACSRDVTPEITRESVAASYNNFYEFTSGKDVRKYVSGFRTDPWTVEVTGLVAKPRTYDLDDLRRFGVEERVYRFRCVETWAMVIPWSGFPLAKLLLASEPRHDARYVRFVSFADPAQMPGVREKPWAPWPYYEGLRIDEAMHELALVATGIYGHALPKQHGAPVRIVVRIELVADRPRTFWSDLAPNEYPFESNVDPSRPHPRWSQATERLLGTFDVRRTIPFNGYGKLVRHLYAEQR